MTVGDTCDKQNMETYATDKNPSDEMPGRVIAAPRTPDMNIVDFSDDISDTEITLGPDTSSDSDLKKKKTKGKKSKKLPADNEKIQEKDRHSDPSNPGSKTKSS